MMILSSVLVAEQETIQTDNMKLLLILSVLTLVALAVAHSDTEQSDLLARETRDAGRRRDKMKKIRRNKKSRMSKKKKRKTKSKNKRRPKKAKDSKRQKAKSGNRKRSQNVKGKLRRKLKQASETCKDASNITKKANSFRSAIKNLLTVVKNIDAKYNKADPSNPKNILADWEDTAAVIGRFTDNGTECTGDCPEEACTAYDVLSNCSISAKKACTFEYDSSNITYCENELDKILETCTDPTKIKECCEYKTILNKESTIVKSCKPYTEIVKEARKARTSCTSPKDEGSFGNCMSYMKKSTKLIAECISLGPITQTMYSTTTAATSTTYSTTTPPTTTTSPSPGTVVRNVFVEGDAVYEQTTSYDPVTNEATIIVPAHNTKAMQADERSSTGAGGERKGVVIILGETSLTTVSAEYCIVEDVPSYESIENYKELSVSTNNDQDAAVSGNHHLYLYQQSFVNYFIHRC